MSALLSVQNLHVGFKGSHGPKVVRGVSFSLEAGETVGLVGESGSGKSITAQAIMGLLPASATVGVGSSIKFREQELVDAPLRVLQYLRGSSLAMVFQDPFSSLNPTMKLGEQVAEVLRIHKGMTKGEATARTLELFEAVRLPDAETKLSQYPHEISGGQRQRVLLAMAFACSPALLIADEPTTALDVTVQAQILILLRELATQSQCGVLLITHDLGVVAASCQRVLVMYAGQIVEAGTTSQILSHPRHPYTQGLLESLPPLDGERVERLRALPGQPPNLNVAVAGCAFYPRCIIGEESRCTTIEPQLLLTDDGSHAVRCHFARPRPSR